ncbi:MAG: CapA family protein [Sandaracinaceae bacterium]|nr:CapA family protein [Sandaracinaceae bacterium]
MSNLSPKARAKLHHWHLILALVVICATVLVGAVGQDAKPALPVATAIAPGPSRAAAQPSTTAPTLAPPVSAAPARRHLVIQGAGDVILHTRVQDSARFHESTAASTQGFGYLVERLRPVLQKGDLNIVNLETPLATQRNSQAADPPMLNGPQVAARALSGVGFHIATLANNHAYDQTIAGVPETRATLADAHVVGVGGGQNFEAAHEIAYVDMQGVRVAVLSFAEMVNGGADVQARLSRAAPQVAVWRGASDLAFVREARAHADIVVVAFHWGEEFSATPSSFQRTTGRQLCEAGASLVLGTHSHTLQPVTTHEHDGNPCVVAYSLGNLISNQGLKYRFGYVNPDPGRAQGIAETCDGAVLRVGFEEDAQGKMRVTQIAAVPLWVENNWEERYYDDAFQNDIFVAPLADLRADASRLRNLRTYEERWESIPRVLGSLVHIVPE